VLTFGLPALVLLLLDGCRQRRWRTVGQTLAAWLYGYAMMWLIKLLSVSAFTGENGFADGFNALAVRTGVLKEGGLEEMYSVGAAIKTVWWVCAPGESEKELFLLLALLTVGGGLLILRRRGSRELLSCGAFLAVAAVPVLWFCCAAQPTRIHAWFQYRSIAVSYAGVFLFAIQGLGKDNTKLRLKNAKNDTL